MRWVRLSQVLGMMVFIFPSLVMAAAEEVVFDYSTSNGGLFYYNDELGHIVRIPEASAITEFGLVLGATNQTTASEDIMVRLYTTTGFQSGTPVNLLWTGVMNDISLTQAPSFYSIDVPSIDVPRVFGFTVETASGHELVLQIGRPAPNQFGEWGGLLMRDNGSWANSGPPYWPFAAKITVTPTGNIPEPTTGVNLICIGLVGFHATRLRKRSAFNR